MKWRRRTDYHGSRLYEPDGPAVAQFSLVLAWAMNVVKGGLRTLLSFGTRPTPAKILVHDGERRFSMLGGDDRRGLRKAADCPFPTKPEHAHNQCDSRVYP